MVECVSKLTFLQGEYGATGAVKHFLHKPNLNYTSEFSEIHVSSSAKKGYIDQYFGRYWLFDGISYLVFPPSQPGLCFKNTGFGFDEQNAAYSQAVTFDTSHRPFKQYLGLTHDVGVGCDRVAVFVGQFQGKIYKYDFSQLYPAFAAQVGSNNTDDALVSGTTEWNRTVTLNETKFDLPPECLNPATTIEYDDAFYHAWGWCLSNINLRVPYQTSIPQFKRTNPVVSKFHVPLRNMVSQAKRNVFVNKKSIV
jgi:hypothetical protein